MTTAELIAALQNADPSGQRTVKIEATGFRGGVGAAYARYPTVEKAWHGIDHDNAFVVMRPTEPLTSTVKRICARNAKRAEREKKAKKRRAKP